MRFQIKGWLVWMVLAHTALASSAEHETARSRAYVEHASAVAIPGIKVCRSTTIGIATQDWIRGTVTEVAGQKIAVRIEAPGRSAQVPSAPQIKTGDVIWDDLRSWTPCL